MNPEKNSMIDIMENIKRLSDEILKKPEKNETVVELPFLRRVK